MHTMNLYKIEIITTVVVPVMERDEPSAIRKALDVMNVFPRTITEIKVIKGPDTPPLPKDRIDLLQEIAES